MCITTLMAVMLQWTGVTAHGKLTVPRSRNEEWGGGPNCAHCLNGGGPCGDSRGSNAYLNRFVGPQATWSAGTIVPVTVVVTAHHRGHYEFRVCDTTLNSNVADPDACLNKWVLERATPEEAGFTDCQPGDQRPACVPFDPKHPERWYLPPSTEITGTHTFYVKVPAGLQCEACTLQWHWWSANSCVPAGDYGCYKDILQSSGYWVGSKAAWWTVGAGTCSGPSGPNGHFGCGEQFWNCADIRVLGMGSPTPTPVPTPSPSPSPTTTPSPTPTTTVAATTTTTTVATTTSDANGNPDCGNCRSQYSTPCIWTDGKCYPVGESLCRSAGATWCGSSATSSTTAAITSTMATTSATTTPLMTSTTVEQVDEFTALDGGSDRACRGADSEDNDPRFYTVMPGALPLNECKDRCRGTLGCVGIEFNPSQGRCEVWTRQEGIGATRAATGYQCFSYSSSSCRAAADSLAFGANDNICSSVCATLGADMWPCSSDGPCRCSFKLFQREVRQHGLLRVRRSSGNSWIQEASSMDFVHVSEEL